MYARRSLLENKQMHIFKLLNKYLIILLQAVPFFRAVELLIYE
jgi:hypothetical protein